MKAKTQFEALGLFDAKVPRYTSYPTAPHFNADVGPATYGAWLGQIAPGSEISLYLHVPFCRRLCWFCACRTQGTQTQAPVAAYVETLKQEIRLLGASLPDVRLSRLHWGGGTPTLLGAGLMRELAETIAAHFPFADRYEFSVEIDPNEIDAERVDVLSQAGMNRASIGVQDFDSHIQNIIGRIQSFETTASAVQMLRDSGIYSLNADILYGLPDQDRATITESVQKLLTLSPDRVALYGYAHVPWMARRQSMIPSDKLPTPTERLELFDIARRLFVWDSYDEVGIDHFAVPQDGLAVAARTGKLRRNFQGYTDDQSAALIGVGASAISCLPQGYAQNESATSRYTASVSGGGFATGRGHAMRGQDKLRAHMIERIMCDFRVSLDGIARQNHAQATRLMDNVANTFDGVLDRGPGYLAIPPEARALTRMVARGFDEYVMDTAGFSSAI